MAVNSIINNAVRMFSTFIKSLPKVTQNGTSEGRLNASSLPCYNWDIEPILHNERKEQNHYALLILNRPILQRQSFMTNLWNNATVRVTVDGGTKRWDKFLEELPEKYKVTMRIKLPELVTGDFDSITDQIFDKYKKQGCEMVHTPDQNYTDFTKALIELNKHCNTSKLNTEHVIAVGQSSGRIDQILGNIQTLFLVKEKQLLDPKMKVYLLSDDAISWLLYPGTHIIAIPKESLEHKRAWCSLVPVGETCESVTTEGLKWNLSQAPLKFGGLVSTSNTFDGSKTVTVTCSHTVLWSMKIPFVIGKRMHMYNAN